MKYLVIGLGNLGRAIAKDLTRVGNEVIGVDMDLHRVDMLKNDIAGAVALDSTDKEALSTLPLSEMDAIIVTFGKDFGTSVQTVALLKSQDAGKLIVRAISSIGWQAWKRSFDSKSRMMTRLASTSSAMKASYSSRENGALR